MSSSEDYDSAEEWVPISKRPEFSDLKPIPQDDGETPLVLISYSEDFKEVHDYFRAIIQKDEKSERAYSLTAEVIMMNPANYTAWVYRRSVIEECKLDLGKELKFTTAIGQENHKNYQVWYHRERIVDMIATKDKSFDPQPEHDFVEQMLFTDAKNYHVWSYRQWLVKRFPTLLFQELDRVNMLLDRDIRNNSAWNQRKFVIENTNEIPLKLDVIVSEMEYTKAQIKKAVNNESAWNYLRSYLNVESIEKAKIHDFCLGMMAKDPTSRLPLIFLLDSYAVLPKEVAAKKKPSIEKLTKTLIKVDPVRSKYWTFRQSQFEQSQ